MSCGRPDDGGKVVESHPQRAGCPVVLPPLAESFRQASGPARSHPHAEVLAFDGRSANSFGVGATHDWGFLHAGDFGGRVPRFAIAGRFVDLDEHGIIRAILKGIRDGRAVPGETIRRHLEVVRRGSEVLAGAGPLGAKPRLQPRGNRTNGKTRRGMA